jgi:hypothetical protein
VLSTNTPLTFEALRRARERTASDDQDADHMAVDTRLSASTNPRYQVSIPRVTKADEVHVYSRSHSWTITY